MFWLMTELRPTIPLAGISLACRPPFPIDQYQAMATIVIMKMPSGSITSYVSSITNATTGGSHCATLTYALTSATSRWLANHIEGTWN